MARLLHRREVWWGNPFRWARWRTYPDALHRLRERHTFRRAEDPAARWRCCPSWQRSLVNKWNGREFARRHGARVPDLYWFGRRPSAIPFDRIPARFVVRPVWGALRKGVHVVVEGRELMRHDPASAPELRRRLVRERGRLPLAPLIVEEFVPRATGDDRLPLEVKFHMFGDTPAAIQTFDRTDTSTATLRFYTPEWKPFEDAMDLIRPLGDVRDPPACLQEMLDLAARLGRAIGTYMRIDFFATDRGSVFNEFASTPSIGKPRFTPFCDELLGRFWLERCPDAV